MGKAAVTGWVALAMLVSGAALVMAATFRLASVGLFAGGFLPIGDLDFVTIAIWLLGAALAVGGVAIALVGLTDRVLGALPRDEPDRGLEHEAARGTAPATARPAAREARVLPAGRPTAAAVLASAPVVATAPTPAVASAPSTPVENESAPLAAPEPSPEPVIAGPTLAERLRPVLASAAAHVAAATRATGDALARAGRATARSIRHASEALVAWVRRTTPVVVAWFRTTGTTVATRTRPAARSTWDGVRHGSRATAAGAAVAARATGATARRASSAAATRARDNARSLAATRAASRAAARQAELDRESARQAARLDFLASRRAPVTPTPAVDAAVDAAVERESAPLSHTA